MHRTQFPVWWLFSVFINFSLLWMVLVPIICFRPVSFLKAIVGSVLNVFYNVDLHVICASVLLEYLLILVTLNCMLLIMVVFDWVWPNFWICCTATSCLYPLLTNCLNKLLENISEEQNQFSNWETLILTSCITMSIIRQMNF